MRPPEEIGREIAGKFTVIANEAEIMLDSKIAQVVAEARRDAFEASVALASPTMQEILLHCGEMGTEERRTVRAVLGWVAGRIRAHGKAEA